LKNLNSVRFMQRAIEYEIDRQITLIESGGRVVQETRLWDERAAQTRVMRSKEEAHDYRYFPEPDLPPLVVAAETVEEIRRSMPELPDARRTRFIDQYELSYNDASQLNSDRGLADYFESAVETSGNPRSTANWIRSELVRELESANLTASHSPVSPQDLGALVRLVDDEKINARQAKEVLVEMFKTGKSPASVIVERGYVQVSDTSEIERIVDGVIAANSAQVEQYKAGKEALFGFFVGQTMKASRGKANPKIVNDVLLRRLKI
jgi:aspartyl-tRNA(Asn)/glutamyl-tRNA(Gln) amidotransferase subunit B